MGKEPTPLEKVTKDADALRKQVDKIVKESVKNANNKKLKDREVKIKANFKSCYDLQPQVTELLQRAEDLSEENETKPKNFETKKKKEVDRIRTWQTQLDDAMTKLLPEEEGENYKKELKKDAGEEEEGEEEKGAKEEEGELGETLGETLGDTAKEEDDDEEEDEEEEEVEEEEVEEEEVEEEEEDDEEEEEESGEEEEVVEEETIPKQIEETKATPKKTEKKPQKVEEEEEEEEDEEDEEDDEDEEEEEGDEEGEGKEETDLEVTTTGRLFEALYDFDGQEKGDLSFKKGDILTILNTREDGWWEAENDKGDKGNVPSTYLQMHNKYKDLQQDDMSQASEEEDEEEEEEEEDEEESPKGKKKVKRQKRASEERTSVTDVLHAMGAVPSGFRISTLGQKFNTESTYTMKNYLAPKLSSSNLSYKDLFFDPSTNKIKGRLSRDQRMVTLTSCRQIPVPGGGLEVTSRHVRICLFDGQNILSNIHTVKVGSVDKEQRTWSFNTKISDLMDTYQHAEVFYRTNSVGSSVGILFELCASYYRESTKERGEFSCGWAHLPLEDSLTGLPIQNKTYDLYVNGGTIYEKGVEVDPSISRRNQNASTNALMSLISGNKQPRLIVKLSVPKREQKELMDTLPDTLIGNASLLQMYSYYRQILADTLLRDRLDLESTEVIHSPVLATFPKIADQHDLMKLLRDTWVETVRGIRRAEMRDEEYMKDTFKKVVMESVYPLFYSASLRDYKSGAAVIEQARQEEIDKFRQQKLTKRGILALLLSSDMTHLPIDMQEVSFNVINPYCLAQSANTQVAVQS